MTPRLILAIVSNLLEEATIVVIVLWGLPRLGIRLPLVVLIVLMVLWLAISVIIYQAGSRALKKKQLIGLTDMVGTQGKVVKPLAPEGMVKIKGELWLAKSASGEMKLGVEVLVVGQNGLKLVVRASSLANDLERTE